MSWLPARRITIGSRIFLGYGVIMALALGFMVVVVSLLVDAHATQVQALERRQRLETSALRLNLALEQESSGVRGYLLQGNEEYLQPYREAILLHQAALDDLQRLVATPEDQAALGRVRERYEAFLIGAERQLSLRRQGAVEASIVDWQTAGRESKEALQAAIADFVGLKLRTFEANVAVAMNRQAEVTVLMLVMMVLAGVSVILSGRRLTKSITQPVDQLVQVATAFSQGRLDQRAAIQTRDELATLAKVMNEMATNLAQSRAARLASLQQTEERNRQLATLNSLAETLSHSLDLRVILGDALDHILSLAAMDQGWVWLLERDTLAPEPLVTRHLPAAELAALHQPDQRAHLLAVARQGTGISIDGRPPQPLERQAFPLAGRSVLIPLATHDRVQGLLAISSATPRPIEERDIDLFQALGRQVAVGIENARLFAAEQRLAREAFGLADMARLVSGTLDLSESLPIIAHSGVSLLGVERCAIILFPTSPHDRYTVYHHGLTAAQVQVLEERGATSRAVADRYYESGGLLSIPDAATDPREDVREVLGWLGARSALIVGLEARGQPLGLLYFDTATRARSFSDHDQRIALAVADQASVGIESAMLLVGVQERAGQLAGMYEIAKVISATLDREELYDVLYRETRRLMDADAFLVGLYSPAEEVVRYVFQMDDGQRYPPETVAATLGVSGHVIRARQPLVASLAEVEALGVQVVRFGDQSRTVETVLCVPLLREERVLGVLSTQSYRPNAYTPQHVALFMAIANQAAIAIENTQLHRRALDLALVEERNRLARDLHDSVTQMLFSMTLTLQASRVLLHRNAAQAEQQIDKAQQTAQEALAEMRALIHQLRPASLQEHGLVAALAAHLDAFQTRSGLTATFRHTGEATLSEAQEQALFRIAQEALNNVVKHAQATQVEVSLAIDETAVTLTVSDDGRGLPTTPAPAGPPTWGLTGMRERAEILGGTLEIKSAPGAGTEVRARLPLAPERLPAVSGPKGGPRWTS